MAKAPKLVSDQKPRQELKLERTIKAVPYVTGFCGVGAHEGASKRAADGRTLLRNCQGQYYVMGKYYTCSCSCHEIFKQIEQLTGGMKVVHQPAPPEPLFIQAQPAITPVEPSVGVASSPVLDVAVEPVASLLGPVVMLPASIGDPAPVSDRRTGILGPKPRTAADYFQRTDSGERARGQLEAEVAEAMWKWFKGRTEPYPDGLPLFTPDFARFMIETEPRPSNGAVRAVFLRWEIQAWVVIGKKPFAVLHPTERGLTALARWKP